MEFAQQNAEVPAWLKVAPETKSVAKTVAARIHKQRIVLLKRETKTLLLYTEDPR